MAIFPIDFTSVKFCYFTMKPRHIPNILNWNYRKNLSNSKLRFCMQWPKRQS